MIDAHNLGTPPRSINLFDYRRFEALSERASDFASGGGTKQGTPFPPSISRALNPALVDEGGRQCCNGTSRVVIENGGELGFGVTPFRECETASREGGGIRERKRLSSKPLSIALRRKIEEQGS